METRNLLLFLEKKLRNAPDSKQKAIDKDIFNTLVTMEKRIAALEKLVEKYERESEET